MESAGTIEDIIRDLLASDPEAAREYLKESFLLNAMSALFHARRDAGLTQAQLAERLHTRQSSIARLERDQSGSVTLRRFIEVALACGVMPFDISFVPVEEMIRFASEAAETPRTQEVFAAWAASHATTQQVSAPQLTLIAPTSANVSASVMETPAIPLSLSPQQPGLWSEASLATFVGGNWAA